LTALSLAVAAGISVSTGAGHAASNQPDAKKSTAKKATGTSAAGLAKGKSLVTASGCAGCHKIGTKGGTTGPDLSHVGAKMTSAQIAAKIKNPKAKNPNSIMPPSTRSDKEIASMAAYLASLK
jgi:mono/diheme cytochrome c family protein